MLKKNRLGKFFFFESLILTKAVFVLSKYRKIVILWIIIINITLLYFNIFQKIIILIRYLYLTLIFNIIIIFIYCILF